MTKLEWCKLNAPDALKGLSDVEIMSIMSLAYDNYMQSLIIQSTEQEDADAEVICGKICPRMSWSDIVSENPDKWIIFTNIEVVKDDRQFICTVLETCDNEDVEIQTLKFIKMGISAVCMRTTGNLIGGIL